MCTAYQVGSRTHDPLAALEEGRSDHGQRLTRHIALVRLPEVTAREFKEIITDALRCQAPKDLDPTKKSPRLSTPPSKKTRDRSSARPRGFGSANADAAEKLQPLGVCEEWAPRG